MSGLMPQAPHINLSEREAAVVDATRCAHYDKNILRTASSTDGMYIDIVCSLRKNALRL